MSIQTGATGNLRSNIRARLQAHGINYYFRLEKYIVSDCFFYVPVMPTHHARDIFPLRVGWQGEGAHGIRTHVAADQVAQGTEI